jgi:hypothetical protein
MFLLQAQKLRPKLAFFLLRHRRRGRAVTAVKQIPEAQLVVSPGTAGASCRPSAVAGAAVTRHENHIIYWCPQNLLATPSFRLSGMRLCSTTVGEGKLSLCLSRRGSLHFVDYPNQSQRVGAQRGFSPCDKGSILAVGQVGITSRCWYAVLTHTT